MGPLHDAKEWIAGQQRHEVEAEYFEFPFENATRNWRRRRRWWWWWRRRRRKASARKRKKNLSTEENEFEKQYRKRVLHSTA
jgi:hypothetical protein